MSFRFIFTILSFAVLALALSGCGDGSSSTGGTAGGGSGGGGGGGTGGGGGGSAAPSVSALSPSAIVIGLPQASVTVIGQGFTSSSQVLIDGQPASETTFTNSGTLQANIPASFSTTAGTHQFSVQNGSETSSSLTLTVYVMQQGLLVMQAVPGFLVGENLDGPSFIVAADVNGDGLADVVMPGWSDVSPGSIAILYGQSSGTLATAQYVSVPQSPYALAVGDIDGNGTPDIVSITSDNGVGESTTVSVLFGDGHGNFQQPVIQQTFAGIFPANAYLVDLDGDGNLDLVLAVQGASVSSTGGTLIWLKNTGGAFAAPVTLASYPGNYRDFCVADFNGDGEPDILYMSAADSSFHILMNQGGGQFVDQVTGGLSGLQGLATALDFNLDGIPDLVVEVSQGIAQPWSLISFSGNGNGTFTQVASMTIPTQISLATGDFDDDGFPDLAGPIGHEPSEILYFFGDGTGNFTMQAVVGPEGEYVAAGDFNGDGIPDVAVPDEFSFVSLSLGRENRNFPSPVALFPATMTSVWTGDIIGNGLQDIFVGGDLVDSIPGTVFLNQGNGSFQFAANTDPSSFEIADLTGKGVVDLLGGNSNLEIWPNNGTANFSSSPITFQEPTSNVTVATMDSGGYPDVVSASGQVFYGNGAYQFTPVTLTSGNWGPYIVGDFTGNGNLDIATGSGTFLNKGNQTFQEVPSNNLPLTEGAMMTVGDFNGDGKDDVAINLPGFNAISIYYSKGDGTFYLATVLDPGQEPGALVAGDFNGDGQIDLAVGLMLSQQACLFFNGGNGQFSRSFFASGAEVVAMAAADLNNDGKLDLVIGNFVLDSGPANVNVVSHN